MTAYAPVCAGHNADILRGRRKNIFFLKKAPLYDILYIIFLKVRICGIIRGCPRAGAGRSQHMKMSQIRVKAVTALILLAALIFAACGGEPEETGSPTETLPGVSETEASTEPQGISSWYTADPSEFRFSHESVCEVKVPTRLYPVFSDIAEATGCVLPALPENFVPQGLDYWEEAGWFIISGYFNPTDKYEYAVLLGVDAETGEYVAEWELYEKDGQRHTGHDGGVAVTSENIYLSTAYTLFQIPIADIKKSGGSGPLRFTEHIEVPVKASFANCSGDYVYVGEFSLNGNASYTITGHEYGGNYAWCAAYRIEPGTVRGISDYPEFVFSIPEQRQGFAALDDGRLFMTCSYGRGNDSSLYITRTDPRASAPVSKVEIGGRKVPLYAVGEFDSVTAISMAEGCCVADGSAYVIFESGAFYSRAYSSSVSKYPTDRIWRVTVD